MKITGVIPARFKSTRFEGKPIVDIYGKPMLWWVYQQAKKVSEFNEVIVAADDERVKNICSKLGIKVIMTSDKHKNHVERLYEVSKKIESDLFVIICVDEPLMNPETIRKVLPNCNDNFIARGIMREFSDPVETIDPGNIKITTNKDGKCTYLSRSPIPYPYKSLDFKYKKIVGVECYNKNAINFFYNTEPGVLENIEDIVLLRFIENGIQIQYILDDKYTLSVDTYKDLLKVKEIMNEKGYYETN